MPGEVIMKLKTIFLFLLIILFPVVSLASEVINIASESTNIASPAFLIKEESPLPASFTSDQLFDRMEKRSETINAIESEVELFDKVSTYSVILRVKSPDKFSITFSDGSSSVFFNGAKLWIYIKSLNECFYYFQESSPWLDKLGFVVSFFNPKKLFLNMTRDTLKTLFDIQAIKREDMPDGDHHYHLKLTPKFKEIVIDVFELGYYEAIFSEKNYLPVKVKEYNTKGDLKSVLSVNKYKINEEVPDKLFEYENTSDAVMVPISIVIMQKFEDYKDKIMKKLDETTESLKNKLLNWSF